MTWAVTIAIEDGLSAEPEVVTRLRKGDLDSLTDLIPLYQQSLYRYLYRLVNDQAAAEDLFQDTWLRAAQNIRRYDPARSFHHWLFSIAHNLAIDYLRRRKPEVLAADFVPAATLQESALQQMLDAEVSAELSRAVGDLPAMYREVLTLRFQEGMKLEQIAQVTQTPLATVKSRLHRSMQYLRERFL
jgi:RNA polymerase sigma-70 factor (ECF subfamily)